MDNSLRKRLAMIKERARRLGEHHRTSSDRGDEDAPCTLADASPGEVHHIDGASFYLIRVHDTDIAADAPSVAERLCLVARRETWPLPSLVFDPGPAMARRIAEERLCFLDIETTGLVPNTYLFLVGLMYLHEGHFVVEQLFAREYDEEVGVLCYLRDIIKRFPMLVTYNGAAFDIPFVQTRMAVARVEDVRPAELVDLLEAAQRHFRDILPNRRLETIERHLRGFGRRGDIPGREIPEAYHEFVRTGNAAKIRRILYHNRMDLLAMAYLVNHLATIA